MNIDYNLNEFATERQWEIYTKYCEIESMQKTSEIMGCSKSTVRDAIKNIKKKASKSGYDPDNNLDVAVPTGYHIKGMSTLYDSQTGEPRLQWVKTHLDHDEKIERIREAIDSLKDELPRIEPTERNVPSNNNDDDDGHPNDNLMAVYPIGDHHIGMLSWEEETGKNYNSSIAESLLCGSINHLVNNSSAASTALIAVLGDFLHYNTTEPVTQKSRNLLDTDTRFANIIRVAFRTLKHSITKALEVHENVNVIIEIGNHDISSSLFIAEALHHMYENEPRVTIDTSPSHFHYFRFGKVLIGTHHGDTVRKPQDLPLIMANDRPKEWGETEYRYWYTGHVHHDSVKDYIGCRVESFRILAPSDSWAHEHGYRSMQDMKAIMIHKEYGEIGRSIINPKMLAE